MPRTAGGLRRCRRPSQGENQIISVVNEKTIPAKVSHGVNRVLKCGRSYGLRRKTKRKLYFVFTAKYNL